MQFLKFPWFFVQHLQPWSSMLHGRHQESFVLFPSISKARKARALDIWESLKPDVEQEMARCGGCVVWGGYVCHLFQGVGDFVFFFQIAFSHLSCLNTNRTYRIHNWFGSCRCKKQICGTQMILVSFSVQCIYLTYLHFPTGFAG